MTQPLSNLPAAPEHASAAEVPAEYDVFCEGCGYSLAGIVADRCPECGKPYDAGELPFARIPWLHRRRLGSVYAYCATVLMVIFRTRRFGRELCRPVRISIADARKFRRVTLRLAAFSVLLTIAAGVGYADWRLLSTAPAALLVGWAIALVVLGVALGVFLALGTDMPVFIWRGLPGRPPSELAPIHHYAAAPLALMPFAGVSVLATLFIGSFDLGVPTLVAAAVTLALVIVLVMMLWAIPLSFMADATGCSPARIWALLLYLPVHWLIMGVMVGAALLVLKFAAQEGLRTFR